MLTIKINNTFNVYLLVLELKSIKVNLFYRLLQSIKSMLKIVLL